VYSRPRPVPGANPEKLCCHADLHQALSIKTTGFVKPERGYRRGWGPGSSSGAPTLRLIRRENGGASLTSDINYDIIRTRYDITAPSYDIRGTVTTETSPTLKARQQELSKDLTNELILRGLAEVILEQGVHAFSVQAVADRAGVSHRTVYRHFSTREELLEGLSLWMDKRFVDLGLPGEPEDTAEILDALPKIFNVLDKEDHMSRAMARVGLTTDIETERRAKRTQVFRERIRAIAPDLDEFEFEGAFAVIRSLASAQQWFILREQFGLGGDRSGPAVGRAVKVLMDDLAARNDAVSNKRGRRNNDDES